ncbi:MAG TPA: universal stress protein [Gaiellales bacterium]|nr:universal stress protein [Gaiellales bacterium]
MTSVEQPMTAAGRTNGAERIGLIAVGVDDNSEACDAMVLATTIARAAGAEIMLVTVYPDLPSPVLRKIGRTPADAQARLEKLQALMAPEARVVVETDWSVPHALERVVSREHPDLLVLGSNRHGPRGRVRIGMYTRQLLGEAKCALAVAPRGLYRDGDTRLATIGVGYDGTPESRHALTRAGSLARAAGAQLRVRALVDDRLPYVGWTPVRPYVQGMWDDVIEPEVESLRNCAEREAAATGTEFTVTAEPGAPVDELIALSREVDLVVIGSRRWGPAVRVLLGSTGEALMHDSCCSVMVAPRPRSA